MNHATATTPNNKRARSHRIAPGDRVRQTAKFLRSTGQFTERITPWLVLECNCPLCQRGNHVAIDEESGFHDPDEEIQTVAICLGQKYPSTFFRHIAVAHLRKQNRPGR